MSYLTDLRDGKLSPLGFLKNSVGWLARQTGLTDDKVDALEKQADEAIDGSIAVVEAAFNTAIATGFPALPAAARAVIAHQAAVAGAHVIDTAVSAAGAFVKANN